MDINQQKKTPQEMVEAIFALDLDPIKVKLMDAKEGQGWSRDEAERHELQYRRFLALLARYPDEVIVPDTDVDKFWHAHILDTMKYAEDCQDIFGYFLHHFPYFGLRGEEDAANLSQAARNTKRLYQKEFGDAQALGAAYCVRIAGKAGAQDASYCVRAVTTQTVADAAHCGVARAGIGTTANEAAYCVRSAASYCVSSAAQRNAQDVVMANRRPSLDRSLN